MSTRKFKEKVYETKDVEDKFLNLIFPKEALGGYVDEEAKESGIILTIIILFLIICGIVSSVTYLSVSGQHNIDEETKAFTLLPVIFSWVLLLSFIFLLFSATRLFHILLFVALISSAGYSVKKLSLNTDKNTTITTIVLASICLAILFYYFTLSRTVTDSLEYREKERILRLEGKYKDRIERTREKADKDIADTKQQLEIIKKEYIKVVENNKKLEKKVEQRRAERKKVEQKLKAYASHGYHDTDDDTTDDD
jgi:hypothetical protein